MEEHSLKYVIFCIKKDAKRHGVPKFITHPGFWVIFSYRIRRLRKFGSILYKILLPMDILVGIIRRCISNTTIPSSIQAGPGLYLPHPEGIIINNMVRIGDNVAIFHQVTLGEWHGKAPRIGNSSSLFPGAKIFGGISIGNNCKIGANSVVNIDVPHNTSVSVDNPNFRSR